jgi:hypothetical protein
MPNKKRNSDFSFEFITMMLKEQIPLTRNSRVRLPLEKPELKDIKPCRARNRSILRPEHSLHAREMPYSPLFEVASKVRRGRGERTHAAQESNADEPGQIDRLQKPQRAPARTDKNVMCSEGQGTLQTFSGQKAFDAVLV